MNFPRSELRNKDMGVEIFTFYHPIQLLSILARAQSYAKHLMMLIIIEDSQFFQDYGGVIEKVKFLTPMTLLRNKPGRKPLTNYRT